MISVFIALCAAVILDSASLPCNNGWVSMGVAHEAGILTSSPDGAIDHPARSPHRRRPATVPGTGHDVQLVHLCEQPCPGFPAGGRADLAVQWPALGLILRGIGERWVC